jgi:hypothetical protein
MSSASDAAVDEILRTGAGILKGMVERSRVELPGYVTEPFEVFLNGVPQRPGADYEQLGRTLVFPRKLASEGRLGFWRWASMLLGIAGTYRKHETVDVVYEAGGRRTVASLTPL